MALPKQIQAARLFLASEHPYIANVLWNLRPVEKAGIGTMGVDQHWRLYYDPDLPNKWSDEEIVGVLFHEVNHILRNHCQDGRAAPFMHCHPISPRCEECIRHNELWNIAADLEENPGIRKLGFKLPEEGAFPDKFGFKEGLLAEEYAHLLHQKYPNPQSQQGQGQGKGGKDQGQGKPARGCGSCAGNQQGYEDNAPGQGSDTLSQTEKDLIIRDVAKRIEDHVKNRGNVPKGLEIWAHNILNPKVPWQKELRVISIRSIAEIAGKRQYSFRRPHRRQAVSETILPSLRDFKPRVGIIRDTSGSMGTEDHARTLGETKGILAALGGEVIDIEVDCQVHDVRKVKSIKEIRMKGGGGTDMGVGIQHAATLKPLLDLCVVLTDGLTPWPDEPPPFRCVVVLTQASEKDKVPTWAKCLVVE